MVNIPGKILIFILKNVEISFILFGFSKEHNNKCSLLCFDRPILGQLTETYRVLLVRVCFVTLFSLLVEK
jgi:hypothetical protein